MSPFRYIRFAFLLVACSLLTCITTKGNAADSLRKALFKTNDAAEQVRLYIALSRTYHGDNADSAEIFLNKALNLARNLKLFIPLGDVYSALGNYAVVRNRIDQALHDYKLAQTFFSKANQKEKYVRMDLLLGNVYSAKDNFPEAINYYMEGIRLGEELNMNLVLAHLHNNMGIIFQETDDKQASLDYLLKAIQYFKKAGNSIESANPLLNMGWIYYDLGNYEMAMNYANKAKTIFENGGENLMEVESMILMGVIESKQEHHKEALKLMSLCLKILNKGDRTFQGPKDYSFSEFYTWIGGVNLESGQEKEALEFLKTGYSLSLKQNQPKTQMRAAGYLSRAYELLKKPDSALFYYKIFHNKSDSLVKSSSINTYKLSEIRQGFEKKQKESELKLTYERSKRNTILIIYIISGIILLAIVFILFLMLKLEKEKKKQADLAKTVLDEKLDFQNKEMTTNVMYLNKMNEQVVQIAEKLKNLQIEEGTHNAKIIRSIVNELQQGAGSDSMKEFEIRFQNVHKDFYKNLLERCPELTPNDLKLCAFLRLNMSTKDISSLTYQSENSLMVARTRLRQKLGMQRQENLITFLAQF